MSSEEISRRRMLKRIGAGAAVAWSAPVLTSIRTPAFAQRYECSDCFSCQASGCTFPQSPTCGGNPDCTQGDWCGCVRTLEGADACVVNQFGQGGPCASSDQCPSGEVCIAICATGCDRAAANCIPLCGGSGPAPKGARRPAARA